MHKYTWKIVSLNDDHGTMIVEYTHDDAVMALNIPKPDPTVPVQDWIDRYAPVQSWAARNTEFAAVQVGHTGEIEFDMNRNQTEIPQQAGSWTDEYLRALIYQVLEEIRESSV